MGTHDTAGLSRSGRRTTSLLPVLPVAVRGAILLPDCDVGAIYVCALALRRWSGKPLVLAGFGACDRLLDPPAPGRHGDWRHFWHGSSDQRCDGRDVTISDL